VERDYETHLLRPSYRQDGKVKNETVANLSHLPADLIEMIRASLAGQAFVPAAAAATQDLWSLSQSKVFPGQR
jgi:hypothetical protein